jgi:hypothetical protein
METREFYEAQAVGLLKELRESRDLSYADLRLKLEAYGVVMTEKAVRNIFYRPHKQFAQMLLILDAMGAEYLEIPKHESVHPVVARPGRALTALDLKRRGHSPIQS